MALTWGASLVFAYLVGAIPFGYLIAKLIYKIDIREHGSKNPGATNVWRTLGKGPGSITLLLDTLKGFIPVFLIQLWVPGNEILALSSAMICIAGHNWSVFLRGKGGKGVATSAGVFFALIPLQMGISLAVFFVIFLITRYVSLGSMSAAVALLALSFLIPTTILMKSVVGLAASLIIFKHIPNMKRLMKGEENRASF